MQYGFAPERNDNDYVCLDIQPAECVVFCSRARGPPPLHSARVAGTRSGSCGSSWYVRCAPRRARLARSLQRAQPAGKTAEDLQTCFSREGLSADQISVLALLLNGEPFDSEEGVGPLLAPGIDLVKQAILQARSCCGCAPAAAELPCRAAPRPQRLLERGGAAAAAAGVRGCGRRCAVPARATVCCAGLVLPSTWRCRSGARSTSSSKPPWRRWNASCSASRRCASAPAAPPPPSALARGVAGLGSGARDGDLLRGAGRARPAGAAPGTAAAAAAAPAPRLHPPAGHARAAPAALSVLPDRHHLAWFARKMHAGGDSVRDACSHRRRPPHCSDAG